VSHKRVYYSFIDTFAKMRVNKNMSVEYKIIIDKIMVKNEMIKQNKKLK